MNAFSSTVVRLVSPFHSILLYFLIYPILFPVNYHKFTGAICVKPIILIDGFILSYFPLYASVGSFICHPELVERHKSHIFVKTNTLLLRYHYAVSP
jgi:hypothetical protein